MVNVSKRCVAKTVVFYFKRLFWSLGSIPFADKFQFVHLHCNKTSLNIFRVYFINFRQHFYPKAGKRLRHSTSLLRSAGHLFTTW